MIFTIVNARYISIHALREEGDYRNVIRRATAMLFLSTPSARRATRAGDAATVPEVRFLSTPSARRATLHDLVIRTVYFISIHALREEGDRGSPRCL